MTYFPGVNEPLFSQGPIYCAFKTTLETRDNTSTLTDDNELVLSGIPAGYYRLTMVLYGKYYTDAGLKVHLNGTNFVINGPLLDHSIWDETAADPDTPTDVKTRAMYSTPDTAVATRDITEDLISPSDLIQFRFSAVNGDIINFTSAGDIAVQWAQSAATSSRVTEMHANCTLSLAWVHA